MIRLDPHLIAPEAIMRVTLVKEADFDKPDAAWTMERGNWFIIRTDVGGEAETLLHRIPDDVDTEEAMRMLHGALMPMLMMDNSGFELDEDGGIDFDKMKLS